MAAVQDAPDYTLLSDVNVIGSVTLNVNVVGSVAIDVNVTNSSLDVHITESTTINVNIVNATLNVSITNAYLDVRIIESVTINANITNSVLNVNITNASIDVNVVGGSLNVNITNQVLLTGQNPPALSFDGVDDYCLTPTSPSLESSSLTVIVFVRGENIAVKNPFFIDKHNWVGSAVKGFWLGESSNRLWLIIGDGTSHSGYTPSTAPMVDGELYMVGFRYDNAATKVDMIYQGEIVYSATRTYAPSTSAVKLGGPYSNRWFQGKVYTVLWYNRPITDFEIQEIFRNPYAPPTNGLVLWYRMDEGVGDVLHDRSGNGNDGTIYGATWVSSQGAAPTLVNVNITSQTAALDVNITGSTVTLNVNIASATTLNINIVSQSIQVDINFGGQTADVQTSGTFFVLGGMGKYFWSEGQIPGVPVFSARWVQTFIDYTVPAGRRMFVESISFNLISRITLWMYNVYGTGATYAIEGVGDPQAEFYVYLGTAIIAKISLNGKKLSTTYVPSIPIRVDAGTRFSVIGIGSIYGVWATVTAIAYERPA